MSGDIDKALAARQLYIIDTLVAERVMKFQEVLPGSANFDTLVCNGQGLRDAFVPTQSIATAWWVVDSLVAEEFSVSITVSEFETIVQIKKDGALYQKAAAYAPLAICLAALATKVAP